MKKITLSFRIVAVLWIIFIANYFFINVDFRNYGIHPRSIDGLIGIITSPFLHGNRAHLISNSIPLFFLLLTILSFYEEIWIPVTIYSILLGGFAVWLFAGGNENHIGASGVIFSYIGFLLASGIFRMSFKTLLISIIIFFAYGGSLLQGVLPGQQGISWQGHLFGAIAGVLSAWIYRNNNNNNNKNKKEIDSY